MCHRADTTHSAVDAVVLMLTHRGVRALFTFCFCKAAEANLSGEQTVNRWWTQENKPWTGGNKPWTTGAGWGGRHPPLIGEAPYLYLLPLTAQARNPISTPSAYPC